MGVPTNKVDIKTMPKYLKWFAYFFYTVIVAGAVLFIVSLILQK